jgi:hypothetical protein
MMPATEQRYREDWAYRWRISMERKQSEMIAELFRRVEELEELVKEKE